ncbi:hypothetical protein D9619_011443 [Psilocybe cf. subviscida]|uniref:Uncharacterized protein n=1 Tax=Psilocybe cf. subviscida TaxID=2480587 RepID=A0A8H5F9J3_9AGAR|nr:hypothetical protein D9619_011443 [Psilocybe cf. subviscida]
MARLGPVFTRRDLGTRTWRSGCARGEIPPEFFLLASATDSYLTQRSLPHSIVDFLPPALREIPPHRLVAISYTVNNTQ